MIKNKRFYKNKITIVLFFVLSGLIFSACKKSNDPGPPEVDNEGFTQEIRNLIPDEYLTDLKNLGFQFNGGNKPPMIEGDYLASPLVLISSNIEDDPPPGARFTDEVFSFFEQDNIKLSVKYNYKATISSGRGTGGFITGDKNSFTGYFEIIGDNRGEEFRSIRLISGEVVAGGIKNFQQGTLMLEEAPGTIKNGSIRVAKDDDGLAERTSSGAAAIPENIHLLLSPELMVPSVYLKFNSQKK